jgi:hypothetical protein
MPRTERTSTSSQTHLFRVSLWNRKSIYRDIEIVSAKSLYHLADAIVGAFDFYFDHCFGFYSGTNPRTMLDQQPQYELFKDIGEESKAKSVKKTKVASAFPEIGYTLVFLFDYGDEWLFRVETLGMGLKGDGIQYPRVVGKKGAAPPQYPDPDNEDWDDARVH